MGPTTGGKATGIASGLIEDAILAGGGYNLGTAPEDLKTQQSEIADVIEIIHGRLGTEYTPLVKAVVHAHLIAGLSMAFRDLASFALHKGVITGADSSSQDAIKQFDAVDAELDAIEYNLTGIKT
jgi:hypothetical protein